MPKNKKKDGVLFICTGNACRSQIAHGLLADVAGNDFNVFSAGTHPSKVHPMAVKIMEEVSVIPNVVLFAVRVFSEKSPPTFSSSS